MLASEHVYEKLLASEHVCEQLLQLSMSMNTCCKHLTHVMVCREAQSSDLPLKHDDSNLGSMLV